MEIKDQLDAIILQLKEHKAAAAEQQAATGTLTLELKTKIEALQKQADALDVKLAERHAAAQPDESLQDRLDKDEGLKKFMQDRSGSYVLQFDGKQTERIFERKTTIDSAAVGVSTSGVLQIERVPSIVEEARRQLTIRDVLSSRPTTMQLIDFVRVNVPANIASPQTESGLKAENAVTFTVKSEKVQTIATWIPASKQILDDLPEMRTFIERMLPYYVELAVERQLLSGAGTGTDLDGLITQATAFATSLLTASLGYNRIDILGRAIQQITTAKELQPTFVALNPVDWWSIRLTKDTQGRYILGDPMGPVTQQQLFGLTPIVTTGITAGTFLVGSGSPIAAEIRDRMGMQVEISTQHSDYFVRNMVAIRAEVRLALIVFRPGSYVTGNFTTSPVS